MFDDVVLRSLDKITFGYWRVRSNLPLRIRSGIEQLIGITKPKTEHLIKIENLGLAIGLDKNEIRASIDRPLDDTLYAPADGSSLLDRMICRIICLVLLIAAFVVVIYSTTQPIYGYATRYGSISPNDFK